MYRIDAYHRPTSVAEAVDLLAVPTRLALAGGTTIRHDGGATPTEVEDRRCRPRCERSACDEISDKALAIGGGVVEAVSTWLNR